MDFISFFSWLIFFLFVFATIYRNFKPVQDNLTDTERKILKDAVNRINFSWDVHSLKLNLVSEVRRLPKCKDQLTQAANKQYQFLQAFYNGNRFADARVKATVFAHLQSCDNLETFYALEQIFSSIIEHSPGIAQMFAHCRNKFSTSSNFNRNSYKKQYGSSSKVKNLFDKCTSLDEVKQRFRRLAFLNHPDRGGKEAAMKEVLRQYQEALSNFKT